MLVAISIVWAISLHEYAHALAADLQGDRLPRAMGRLSVNPARHLDPVGTLFIFLAGFGWGKPVEFRPQALSSRFGAALVALAGPLMNLLLAVVGAFVLVPLIDPGEAFGVVQKFLLYFVSINILLAVFNLLPLPPLDGSRLLTIFLPRSKQKLIFWLDKWGFVVLVLLILLTGLRFLDPIIQWVRDSIFTMAGA